MKFNLPSTLPALLLGLLTLSGCAITITHTGDAQDKTVRSGPMTRFECVQSPSGECNYAVFTSQCNSQQIDANGKASVSCTHQVIEQFKLNAGGSRDVTGLPSGFKQCMSTAGAPEVPACAGR